MTQGNLTEARQQLANISQQAGPTSGSVFTNNKSSEQCSHQCLGKSLHHQSDLLPSWILSFSWTEIIWGPMSETGKLHKNKQWNKAGTMTNSDSLDALLHIVHVKIFSYQRTSCKKHRMPLLQSGWRLIQYPNWPPMNHTLFTAIFPTAHCQQNCFFVIFFKVDWHTHIDYTLPW